MATQQRRERERAERERKIVRVARRIAEADGWSGVTMRRLSDEIEYSQPVLYGHFEDGRSGIVRAVAMQGFEEFATNVEDAAAGATSAADALRHVVLAYLEFADTNPATYEAMFSLPIGVPFAVEATPALLVRGFVALKDALERATGPDPTGVRTELLWSTLHGVSVLTRDGRVPRENQEERVAVLLETLLPEGMG